MTDDWDLTRIIGMISLKAERARTRRERRRLLRLVAALCEVANARQELARLDNREPRNPGSDIA